MNREHVMSGYCQQCRRERSIEHPVEIRVANRTVDADGRAGDRKAFKGSCAVCGTQVVRFTTEMYEEA